MTVPVQSWLNKREAKTFPDWVAAEMVGGREANGTFLIKTRRGQQRVHVGGMVFSRNGDLYSCHPSEAWSLIAEIEEGERGSAHLNPPPGIYARDGLQADTADRADDTDDISLRIQRGVAISREEISPKPLPRHQKVAETTPEEIGSRTSGKPMPAPIGMPPSIEMRYTGELKIDDSYQRSIDTGPSRALIERIARGWDWRMCLPLVVSKRADGLYVIDGQHRHAAAQRRGDIPFLPCCIAVYENVAEEAAMFVAMNRSRRAVNRLDDFHAAQASGNADALAIAALVEGAGFTVSRRTGSAAWAPGEVAFTSAIAKERRRRGEAIVREALAMMAAAFPRQRLVAGSSVFTAICAVMGDPPAGFSKDRLAAALCAYDMPGWASFLDQSRGGTDRAKHLKDMLLAAYEDAGRQAA